MRLNVGGSALGWVCRLSLSVSCTDDVPILTGDLAEPELAPVAEPPAAPPDPRLEQDAAWVFDDDAVRVYELALADSDWEALQATALEERYFPATLSVDGAAYGEVGLRFKGNRGSLGRCGGGVGTPGCPKISMKIKFDEYHDAQRFFGLKRLNFNSMWADSSWMHERLAYQLYREMGIAAPRAAHARLIVNGDDRGVFSLVEQIDGRFTDDRFAGGDGNLYKEQWPIVDNPTQLDRTLETNEEVADHSSLIQLYRELAAAAPDELVTVAARYWDVDQLLAYLAVDRVTTNWDGVTGFYCRGGGCYNHNYYIYQHEHEARFSLIPWDLDNTFRPITPFDRTPMPLDVPDDCSSRYPVFPPLLYGMAPGCDRLFRALALAGRERYAVQLARLLDGPFELGRLEAWIDARFEQLWPHAETDAYALGAVPFELAVETLRADLRTLVARAEAERDGALEPFRLRLDATNDFESTSALSLQLGILRRLDYVATFSTSLETPSALRGRNNLLLSYRLAPEADPAVHWLNAWIPFTEDLVDLSDKSAIRMVMQSDGPRVVRIALESAVHSPYSPAAFGWDVALDQTPRDVELRFSEANYPATGPALSGSLADVLRSTTALLVQLRPAESRTPGVPDAGELRLDDLQLVP